MPSKLSGLLVNRARPHSLFQDYGLDGAPKIRFFQPNTMSMFAHLAVVTALANVVVSGLVVLPSNNTTPGDLSIAPRWDKSATADDALWAKAVCRGGEFVDAFKGTDEQAGKIFKSTAKPPTMHNQWQEDLKSIPPSRKLRTCLVSLTISNR